MKEVLKLDLEYNGETKQYYIFKAKEGLTEIFPKKIYIRKDLFGKQVKNIQLIITEKEK